jgi:hypothetical protein
MIDCIQGKSDWLSWATITSRTTNSYRTGSKSIIPLQNAVEVELKKKSYRIRRSTILSDHVVYLPESDVDIQHKDDPNLSSHAMSGENSTLRFSAMK